MSRRQRKPGQKLKIAALLLAFNTTAALAQELEPRAYSPAPVGLNFLGLALLHSSGDVSVDPSLPVRNVEATADSGLIFYTRTFGLFGRAASVGLVLPYVQLEASGDVLAQQRSVERSGLADPRLRLAVNLLGGPALTPEEFSSRRPATTLGTSLTIVAPFGEYDSSHLVNLGSNRWAFRPELGLYHSAGPWGMEISGGAWFFTDNDDFFGGHRREQDPLYTVQVDVSYTFRPHLWLALGTTHYAGGETTVDGVHKADRQANSRVGLALSLPVDRNNSVKFTWSKGVAARVGNDFMTFGIAWQYAWLD